MKTKTLILAIMLSCAALPCMAQHNGGRNNAAERKSHREITEMVGDLSQSQRKRLETITDASKERVAALRARQKAVRDSIAIYMKLDGDQSKALFPLFDREAQLQRDISREMYTTKVRVDEVLTPDQRRQLREAMHKPRKDAPKKSHK